MFSGKIYGEQINLRRITARDAESLAYYLRDPDMSRFTFIPRPYTIDDAYAYIKLTQKAHRRRTQLVLGIEDKESKQIIGMIGAMSINRTHNHAEIGYWLAKEHWGKGIMGEAVNLMLAHLFGPMKLRRVFAHVNPVNKASVQVLERAGFKREGLLRKLVRIRGRYFDQYLYAILKVEFEKRK